MNYRTLNKSEIDRLYSFVQSKYVRYLDVQLELVDHLASGIEDLQSKDPNLSFETALNKIYRKFPVTGFHKLVEEKSKSLSKYWTRKMSLHLVNYFKLPRIIISFLIFIFLFSLARLFIQEDRFDHFFMTLIIGSSLIIFIWLNFKRYHDRAKVNKLLGNPFFL